MIFLITFIISAVYVQTDWSSGSGVEGPVLDWGKAYYQADSMTHNVVGQVSPIATDVNLSAPWTKHIISQDANIYKHSIVPADFDGDGDFDLVGWKGGSAQLVFYENIGDSFVQAAFKSVPLGGDEWQFIAVNDLNGDSLPDVVIGNSTYGGLGWFENKGDFTFVGHPIDTSSLDNELELCMETGDIDNDGDIDLIVGGRHVKVWKNDGTGKFMNTQTISGGSFGIGWREKLSDLDGNGSLDLIIGDPFTNYTILIYFNDGNGNFSYGTDLGYLWGYPGGVDGLWSQDFNNDGNMDILCGVNDGTYFNLYWYENDGTGALYVKHNIHNGVDSYYGDGACGEDIDMDGKADVVSGFSKIGFFRQNTLDDFTAYAIDDLGTNYTHWVIPLKIDRGVCQGSGQVDILACAIGGFYWYENNMITGFSTRCSLVSSILNAGCDAEWLLFGYDVCTPDDGALSFQFRFGNSQTEVASAGWSAPVYAEAGVQIDTIAFSGDSATMFQYRINCKGDVDAPIIYEVWVQLNCMEGIEEAQKGISKGLEIRGKTIYYSLAEKTNVSLALYDLTGRIVKVIEEGTKGAGSYLVPLPDVKSGAYFVVLSKNGVNTGCKVIVLR